MKPSSLERAQRLIVERPPEEQVYDSVRKLLRPIGEHEFSDEGTFRWETSEHHVVASYDTPKDPMELFRMHGNAQSREWEHHEEISWKKMRSLVWEVFGQRIDLLSLIPEGISVFFAANTQSEAADYVPADKAIYVNGDFLSPVQLVVLLHEIGHTRDYAEKGVRIVSTLDLERAANAFALNTLRPSFIVNDDWKTDVVNLLKHGSLHHYAQQLIQQEKSGNLGLHRGDWDDMYLDDEDR